MKHIHWPEIIGVLAVVGLFILSAWLAQVYKVEIESWVMMGGVWGVLVYVLTTVVAVVLAPISTFPLLPVAVSAWGSLLAAVYSVIGWTIGAGIAFELAKRYGRPVIAQIANLDRIDALGHKLPSSQVFVGVVLLRMVLPVDVLSYALGLFVPMSFGVYIVATFIGVIPFALVFAYAVNLSWLFQLGALAVALVAVASGWWWVNR